MLKTPLRFRLCGRKITTVLSGIFFSLSRNYNYSADGLTFTIKNGVKLADFRSDTVTRPTDEMREAMSKALVGDDVMGDDYTVKELEAKVSELLGKEAALFVPSGTMSNLIAVGTHCARGQQIILGKKSHIFVHEAGGASAFMGVSYCTIPNQLDGTLLLKDIEESITPDDVHRPRTSLVCLEDTNNLCGGVPLPEGYIASVASLCQQHGLKLHLDGARLLNAAVALKKPVHELAGPADTISLCLSKGLGAPVGSVLAGTQEFIHRAKYLRKALGGGMRQSGIVAAAGIYALDNNVQRLALDHQNAHNLAVGLSKIPGVKVDLQSVKTNMVYFDVGSGNAHRVVTKLQENGILTFDITGQVIRAVTHLQINEEDINRFLDVLGLIMSEI